MRTPRNQLIIAIVFALLLGVIIVVAARCSSNGAAAVRTPTPKTTGTPARVTGTVTVVPGRATDVTIAPPGGSAAPTPTQITVGPLPSTAPVTQTTGVAVQPATSVTAAPTAVPAAAAPTVAVPSGGTTHIVKSGETLGGIAKIYGTTTTAIAQANNLTNPSLIRVGQRLVIPGVSAPASSSSTGGRTYVVKKGDYLSRIAAKYGVTVDAIVKANNLKNASLIYAGQKLIIP
jgi:LysM repeat protein